MLKAEKFDEYMDEGAVIGVANWLDSEEREKCHGYLKCKPELELIFKKMSMKYEFKREEDKSQALHDGVKKKFRTDVWHFLLDKKNDCKETDEEEKKARMLEKKPSMLSCKKQLL